MAKRVPYLGVNQIVKMSKTTRSVVFGAIHRGELVPMNAPAKEGVRFVRQFDPKVVEAWMDSRKPAKKVWSPQTPLPFELDMRHQNSGPGRLTSIDEKLDAIMAGIARLERLWS